MLLGFHFLAHLAFPTSSRNHHRLTNESYFIAMQIMIIIINDNLTINNLHYIQQYIQRRPAIRVVFYNFVSPVLSLFLKSASESIKLAGHLPCSQTYFGAVNEHKIFRQAPPLSITTQGSDPGDPVFHLPLNEFLTPSFQ